MKKLIASIFAALAIALTCMALSACGSSTRTYVFSEVNIEYADGISGNEEGILNVIANNWTDKLSGVAISLNEDGTAVVGDSTTTYTQNESTITMDDDFSGSLHEVLENAFKLSGNTLVLSGDNLTIAAIIDNSTLNVIFVLAN